jgi:hypothetical protein
MHIRQYLPTDGIFDTFGAGIIPCVWWPDRLCPSQVVVEPPLAYRLGLCLWIDHATPRVRYHP